MRQTKQFHFPSHIHQDATQIMQQINVCTTYKFDIIRKARSHSFRGEQH